MAKENESESLRSYNKSDNPSLEIRDVRISPTSKKELDVKNPQLIKFNGREYTKPLDGSKDFCMFILIIEDAQRTYKYFWPIENKNIRGFKLIPIVNKEQGIPAPHMKAKAEECINNYALNFESGDELYMLCDLDHYRHNLIDLMRNKQTDWQL